MDSTLQRSIDALTTFFTSDAEQRQRVSARRQLWTATVKATILDTFNQIVNASPQEERGLCVLQGHLYDNFESVQIGFGSIPTGIVRRTPTGGSIGVERGATLVFGQSENGKIAVSRYPFSTELPSDVAPQREPSESVGAFEPEELTREFILNQAKEFFEWAGRTSFRRPTRVVGARSPIGFIPPRVELTDGQNGEKAP